MKNNQCKRLFPEYGVLVVVERTLLVLKEFLFLMLNFYIPISKLKNTTLNYIFNKL